MTELDKIKESLARHTHSSAVMRLANPPFVEGVSKEQVEWLIAENEDKHVADLKWALDESNRLLTVSNQALKEAEKANESNLSTIQQFSGKIAVLKMNHAHEIENHKHVIADQYALIVEHAKRIAVLEDRSWWQHTKDSFAAWWHAHVV